MARAPAAPDLEALKSRKKALAGLLSVLSPTKKANMQAAGSRCFFAYRDRTQALTIKTSDTVYSIAITHEPYLLFDTNEDNLKKRATKAGVTNPIPSIARYPVDSLGAGQSNALKSCTPASETDDVKTTYQVIHEIKAAEIGDEAVQALLNNESQYTAEMVKFLNSDQSKETRKALGLPLFVASDTNSHVKLGKAPGNVREASRNCLKFAHQVAVAREAHIAFDAQHKPLKEPIKITYVEGYMPRLGISQADAGNFTKYAISHTNNKIGNVKELQSDYKNSILAQMKAAYAAKKKGLVINPPSAFIGGLSPENQKTALKLWMQAANEAATEFATSNSGTDFKLVVNTNVQQCQTAFDTADFTVAPTGGVKKTKSGLLGTQHETTANEPNSIEVATKNDYAFAIGGHPTNPFGNGAPSDFRTNDDRTLYTGDELFHRLAPDATIADDATYGKEVVVNPPVAALVESFDVLAGFDSAKKITIIETACGALSNNPAMQAQNVTFAAPFTVTATDDTCTIKTKITITGKNEPVDLTIIRTTNADGTVTRSCTCTEKLSTEQQFALLAAASFQERVAAAVPPSKLDTTIKVSIAGQDKLPLAEPTKDGLTADEQKLVSAYLAAGYTQVQCGRNNKCFDNSNFKAPGARASVVEKGDSKDDDYEKLITLAVNLQKAIKDKPAAAPADDSVDLVELAKQAIQSALVDYVEKYPPAEQQPAAAPLRPQKADGGISGLVDTAIAAARPTLADDGDANKAEKAVNALVVSLQKQQSAASTVGSPTP